MKKILLVAFATLFIYGCNDGGSVSPAPGPGPVPAPESPDLGLIDVIHASADAPNVNVSFSGTQRLNNIRYQGVSQVYEPVGTVSIEVEGIIPGGNAVVIGPADVDATLGGRTTVIALNTVTAIEPLVLTESVDALSADDAQVRIVHGAPDAPMVDVYVTAPGVDLDTVAPLGTFEFRGVLGPVSVPAGTYQLRVTAAGDSDAVVYDADASLTGGTDAVIVAVENTGPGPAPISLVAAIFTGPNEILATARILDRNTTAPVRVIHASPDAPNVDIVANDDFAALAVADLAFPVATDYLPLAAGPINVKVVPTGVTDTGGAVINADLALEAGVAYSVYATGFVAEIEALVLTDDNRSIATESRVRIVHGSPSAGEVDIYVVEPGADIAAATPAFSAVPLRAETGYVSLAPDSYDVVVTPTGTTDVAIYQPITVEAGGVYTAVARDATGGGGPLGLILMDDFAP